MQNVLQKKQDFEEKRGILKKRMLGNVKFIGELYKKDMLKEAIIHECLHHLLKLNTEESKKIIVPDEEDLEAVGKLMSTIGKKLDAASKESKEQISKYMGRLKKISEDEKKVSARIRFMVRDLLDLRKNEWNPRRQEAVAKTMKEVRRDAEREIGAPTLRPATKGGGGRGGMVPNRSLPPPPQNFARSNTMPAYLQQQHAPSMRNARPGGPPMGAPGVMHASTSARPYPSREPSPGALNRFPGQTIRLSHSDYPPSRGGSESGHTTPRRGVGPDIMLPERKEFQMDQEIVDRKIKSMTEEYLINKNDKELAECLKELPATQGYSSCIYNSVLRICECKDQEREDLIKMVVTLYRAHLLLPTDFEAGLKQLIEQIPDLIDDIPKLYINFGQALGPFLLENCIPIHWLLVQSKNFEIDTTRLICYALDSMIKHAGPDITSNFCRAHNVKATDFIEQEADAIRITEEKGYFGIFPSMREKKLRGIIPLLQSSSSVEECFNWLNENGLTDSKTKLLFAPEMMDVFLQVKSEEFPSEYVTLLKDFCQPTAKNISFSIIHAVASFRSKNKLAPGMFREWCLALLDHQIISLKSLKDWPTETNILRMDPDLAPEIDFFANM